VTDEPSGNKRDPDRKRGNEDDGGNQARLRA
jgi:hypothetical protein